MPPIQAAPPTRHNYYNDEDFIRADPARGTCRDAAGRPVVRASADLLPSLQSALTHQVGDKAADVLYKLGRRWGEADFRSFAERVPREFGVDGLEQMHFNVMLETWRWSLTAAGWGAWRYDFRRARVGLPVVLLSNSAVVTTAGGRRPKRGGAPVCYIYAGLFAAVFSTLAQRELNGIELQCAAGGADSCQFLVASAQKAAMARTLRDDGMPTEELLDRLATASTADTKPRKGGKR